MVAEGPFAHRSLFGVIPFQALSAIGLACILYTSTRLMQNLRKYCNLTCTFSACIIKI